MYKKNFVLQLAFFYIQAVVSRVKFVDQIFFTNFSYKSVFRLDFFDRNELQITNRMAGESKMHTNRGRGMDLPRLDDGPPVLPQSGPHLLPRLPDVLGVGRAHSSSSGTCYTIYHILRGTCKVAGYKKITFSWRTLNLGNSIFVLHTFTHWAFRLLARMKTRARSSCRPLRPAWRKTSSGEHLTKILNPLIADHGLLLENLLHLLVLHKYLPPPGQNTGQFRKPRVVADYKSNPLFRPPLPANLSESVLSIQKFDFINLNLHTLSSVSSVQESLHQLHQPLLQELQAPTDLQESIH